MCRRSWSRATGLASTVETWWLAIAAFPTASITNAKIEGISRLAKGMARRACGFRNPAKPPGPRAVALHPRPTPGASTCQAVAPSRLNSPHAGRTKKIRHKIHASQLPCAERRDLIRVRRVPDFHLGWLRIHR